MGLILGLCVGSGAVLVLAALSTPGTIRITHVRRVRPTIAAEVWPDIVDDLGSAVKAGLSLPQAIAAIAQSGPMPARSLFTVACDTYLATGDLAAGLAQLRAAAADPVADTFCSALTIAHDVGGYDLATVLRTLSEVIREDIKVRAEIRARQSWTVNGARLAVGAPWVTVLLLSTRSDAARVYATRGGITMLCICAVVTALAYAVMIRVGRLPRVQAAA